jgi:hypothetical protein
MKRLLLVMAAVVLLTQATHYRVAAQRKAPAPPARKKTKTLKQEPSLPVCNLGAMNPVQRQRHDAIGRQLRKAVKQVKEIPNGFSFRYENDPSLYMAVAEFISLESRCCSFYSFSLEKEQGEGPIWLHIRGSKENKCFIKAVLAP